ncbi:MAG TPA: iron hydrogenase small subunit, partial [Halanaerobiales bacterium]|nr:iron hydrogenase small subunit [Halanaerobiales bacterium]
KEIKEKRGKGLASIDESKVIRKSHKNPMIVRLYEEYLGEPLSGDSHHLLHTKYRRRDRN